jgi:benzoyl-CoA reductase/2-hydroxyglutaryl-CoA dehydratase subunit BcrC/BadD/HgdB
LEAELKILVEANRPENRNRWALRWKERGKVIGVVGPNIPEEVIFAAGMLPWGAIGTWEATTPLASAYRPSMTSVFCTHLLESILNGELDFLNGVVTCQYDDDFKHLWAVQDHLQKPRFNYIMYLPHVNNRLTLQAWKDSIMGLKKAIEELGNLVITDAAISRAIDVYNTTRRLLRKVYDLRKRETPALTGAEVLGITTAARIMPKDEFNRKLEVLLPYLEDRKVPLKQTRPRLLVSSDYLYHLGYIELIENAGAVVAMDDMNTGSRYFWNSVDTSFNLWGALADRYLNVSSPRMSDWRAQIDQEIGWVKEFNIDGIIELRQLYNFPREFYFTYHRQRLAEAGIPHLNLRIEYHLAGVGMLKTRVEAFLEMLRGKRL